LRYLAKITKGIEGVFLRYSPTRALVVNAIVRIAMILSISYSIERTYVNSLEQTGDAGRFHFEGS
jgi:hypothetical protein